MSDDTLNNVAVKLGAPLDDYQCLMELLVKAINGSADRLLELVEKAA